MHETSTLDRLRITRELTDKEYKRLMKYEEEYGELTVEEIANMFGLIKVTTTSQ